MGVMWLLNQHIQTVIRKNADVSNDYEADFGTPTTTVTTFPSTQPGSNNGDDTLVAIDANISSTDAGMLFEAGGNFIGCAIGVNAGTMRARAFKANTAWGSPPSDGTELEVSISSYTGSDATYYLKIDDSIRTMSIYVQAGGKGSSNTAVLLGSDSASGSGNVWGGNGKGYGRVNSSVGDLTAPYEANFSGTIDEIRVWSNSSSRDVSSFPTSSGSGGSTDAVGFLLATAASPSVVGSTSDNVTSSLALTGISGLSEGDVVLAFSIDDNQSHTINSAGWTDIGNIAGGNQVDRAARKTMGATPDTTVTTSITVDVIAAIAFRAVEYEGASTGTTGSGTTITPQSITVTEDDSIVLVLAMIDDDVSSIATAPTGYTTAVVDGGNDGAGGSLALFYKTGVSAGTESPSSVVWTTSDTLSTRTFLLKPLGGGTGATAVGFQL